MNLEAADILVRAACEVLDKGLAKGAYRDNSGRYCAIGALAVARDSLDSYEFSASFVAEVLAGNTFQGAEIHDLIVVWNDQPERTAEEVADLLLRAADLAGGSR